MSDQRLNSALGRFSLLLTRRDMAVGVMRRRGRRARTLEILTVSQTGMRTRKRVYTLVMNGKDAKWASQRTWNAQLNGEPFDTIAQCRIINGYVGLGPDEFLTRREGERRARRQALAPAHGKRNKKGKTQLAGSGPSGSSRPSTSSGS